MKKTIFTLLLAIALGSASAQVRVGLGFSFGAPFGIGYPYGAAVIAPRPLTCAPIRPVYVPRYHYLRPAFYAPPIAYMAPRYRGMHYGRRW
jgi:hypothetical protein